MKISIAVCVFSFLLSTGVAHADACQDLLFDADVSNSEMKHQAGMINDYSAKLSAALEVGDNGAASFNSMMLKQALYNGIGNISKAQGILKEIKRNGGCGIPPSAMQETETQFDAAKSQAVEKLKQMQ
jgi:hypothetical protein